MPTSNDVGDDKRNLKDYKPKWEGYTCMAETVEGCTQ
jgi:hypothetical protein